MKGSIHGGEGKDFPSEGEYLDCLYSIEEAFDFCFKLLRDLIDITGGRSNGL